MEQYRFPTGKKNWILACILFVLLLLARDTLVTSCLVGFIPSQFTVIGILGVMLCVFLWCNRKRFRQIVTDKRARVALASSLIVLVPMLVKRDWQLMYFSILICIWFAIFLSYFTRLQTIAGIYVIIITGLSVYSLAATYLFKSLTEQGLWKVGEFTNSASVEFYNYGLAYVVKQAYYYRNFGIFREPGVYQFFILLALFLNNYKIVWNHPWKLWAVNLVLCMTMLSTFATGGIVELLLLALILVLDKKWYKKKVGIVLISLVVIAGIAGVCYVIAQKNGLYWTAYSMVEKLFVWTDSSSSRFSAIVEDLRLIRINPIFGSPIAQVMYVVQHNTTSTLLLYAIFGVVGGTLAVIAWVRLVWDKKRAFLLNGLLLMAMFMSFNTQNLIADTFFLLFPVMAMLEKNASNVETGTNATGRRENGEDGMQKVLFVSNIPSPYRMIFFNKLGECCDLTVAFEGQFASDRDKAWYSEKAKHFTSIYMKGRAVNNEQFFCPQILSVIRKGKFDRIILGGYASPTAMMAIAHMRLCRIPFYIEVDGGLIREQSGPKYWLKKALVSSASGWISSGQYPTEFLVHYGAKREKVWEYPFSSMEEKDILPCIVSGEEKTALRKELSLNGDRILLSIGQFIPRKGFDVLMRAAALLDENVGVHIIGGEPPEEYLQMKADLGLKNITFHAFKSKAELAKYYQAADLFVLPTREDIWGLVINEAMAYGLPVITTDKCVAGLELVENGVNGYIVPVEDHEALAEKINCVFHSDVEKMSAASLEKIRPQTIENMVRVHMDILQGKGE